jgi:hypothetical protein
MTSYRSMSRRGGEAAAETNQTLTLRRPIDVRLGIEARNGIEARVWQVIGECGHVLHQSPLAWHPEPLSESDWYRNLLMNKRRRCAGCPKVSR